MPGYDTHYLFGIKTYRNLPEGNIKAAIRRKKDAYVLGMLGPDIFFYYATEVVAIRKNLGSVMHTQRTDKFLRAMIQYVEALEPSKNSVELAYLCGFLTHYYLDVKCHPYVYWRTDYLNKRADYLEKHYQYENDIDVALLRIMRNTTPYEFAKISQIKIQGRDTERVCKMLHYAIHRTYRKSNITVSGIWFSILSVEKEQMFLRKGSHGIKNAIGVVEEIFMGQMYLALLIPGVDKEISEDPLNLKHEKWENPWNRSLKYTDSVPEMMETAAEDFSIAMHLLEDYLFMFRGDKQVYQTLIKRIGRNSYHSGLDCELPEA